MSQTETTFSYAGLLIFILAALLFSVQVNATEAYTPQQAVDDVLSEHLTFVGRGILDPVLDDNGQPITTGVAYSCVYKNSRVYVLHHGCRPTAAAPLSVFSVTVFSRSGGSIEFYIEGATDNYTLAGLGRGTDQSWKLTYNATPPITSEFTMQQFFDFNNGFDQLSHTYCMYGVTMARSHTPGFFCSRDFNSPEWSTQAQFFWQFPDMNRFTDAHDAIRNAVSSPAPHRRQ